MRARDHGESLLTRPLAGDVRVVPALSCLALRHAVACRLGQAAPPAYVACTIAALADRISQLQGRPDCLLVCERSAGPHLHAPFAASMMVDLGS